MFRGIGSGRGVYLRVVGIVDLLIGDWIFRGIGSGRGLKKHQCNDDV